MHSEDRLQMEDRVPFLAGHDDESSDIEIDQSTTNHQVPPRITRRLYISHFLSTWNSRVFEFGAVLYLAKIFPNTLLPMSIYAVARGLAAIVFSPLVGQYIDVGERLQVVRVSIVVQRVVVAASCVIFYLLYGGNFAISTVQNGMLVSLAGLACFEKLASILNFVSVEKDWVVVVAGGNSEALRAMNAQMRRIDLICKLIGPLGIALLDGWSTRIAIIVNFAMNLGSIVVEYFAIARVYSEVPALQTPKTQRESPEPAERSRATTTLNKVWQNGRKSAARMLADTMFYFKHQAFLPSFAGALLYLTVLSFGGQMVTYLLSSGYNSTQVGIARTFSVLFEVLATWIAPWLMTKIGSTRAGLWMSSWQLTTLVAGLVVFWSFSNPVVSASGLVVGTILSRVGLFGFDLCAQVIVQEDVEADRRGAFSSVEAAFQNAFELLSFTSTIIFSHPEHFKYPTLISTVAVTLACSLQAIFVRHRRKHLLHVEYLAGICGTFLTGKRTTTEAQLRRADVAENV